MNRQAILINIKTLYTKLPPRVWILISVCLTVLVSYSLIFFIPKSVQFSYQGETCARQLILFPSIQRPVSDEFTVSIKDELKIGSFPYAATKVCAELKNAPQEGSYAVSVRPFGALFMAKPLSIQVGAAPLAKTSDLVGKTISTALPLKVALTSEDRIHTYRLAVSDVSTKCSAGGAQLICEVAELNLEPGETYTASLTRSFKNSKQTKLAEGSIETLKPIILTEGSISEGTTIYDSPQQFSFAFDKAVASAEVKLEQKGDAPKQLQVTTREDGSSLIVSLPEALPRKAQFSLALNQVVSEEGNALDSPIAISFTTSGGPKPSAVSVGATNVPQAARVLVTLDQPIKDDVDITKVARVTGVEGTVTKKSPTELVFGIQAGLCQQFSLVIDEGVASASNSAVSEPWKHDARTICGISSVIGSSVQGRPLTAHYFGNGATTILFTGGIHGEERSAQQTMQAWVEYLMVNGYKIPADKRVVVVPNLNPDGIARGTRNNANNVNLGRNYPSANWKASIETSSGVLPTGGGASPGSEPETKAMMTLTRQLQPRLEVSFHAQGRLVGANKVSDSVAIGDIYANTVGYNTMYHNAEAVMGYSITGEYEEWMGETMGIPAILIELPTRNGSYLTSQLNALMKMLAV